MTFKKACLKLTDEQMLFFFFPSEFSGESIIEAIRAIRTGDRHNWNRNFRDNEVEVTEATNIELNCEYKYIVIIDEFDVGKNRYMTIFPKSINHDFMLEVIQMAAFENDFPNNINPFGAASAGFISSKGGCFGHSESLDVGRAKEDSDVFKNTFKEKINA